MHTQSMPDRFRDSSMLGGIIRDSIFLTPPENMRSIGLPQVSMSRDPEGFYYDNWPETGVVVNGALTCGLWRHQLDKQIFKFTVRFTKDDKACGMIECTVHAQNLTKPKKATVIVRRLVERLSMVDLAEQMLADWLMDDEVVI